MIAEWPLRRCAVECYLDRTATVDSSTCCPIRHALACARSFPCRSGARRNRSHDRHPRSAGSALGRRRFVPVAHFPIPASSAAAFIMMEVFMRITVALLVLLSLACAGCGKVASRTVGAMSRSAERRAAAILARDFERDAASRAVRLQAPRRVFADSESSEKLNYFSLDLPGGGGMIPQAALW